MKDCNEATPGCIGRREFLVKAGLVAGATVLTVSAMTTGRAAAFEDVKIEVTADSPLAKVGGFLIVTSTAGKLIVIRRSETDFAAFSAKCTHKGATVKFDPALGLIRCPSHGSEFSPDDGTVKKGPADQPLAEYGTTRSDSGVVVSVP